MSKYTLLKKIILGVLFHCQFPVADSQTLPIAPGEARAYFQQKVNYKIDVTLNDVGNTLDGFEIMDYTNNSPDTLYYIWFHFWPNAYKNDRTAFSEQLLRNGRTDFYFSNNEKRGYINRLDFKVDGITSKLIDHPQYIDVAKLILPAPLLPGRTIKITTPFHEKIPFNFSRGGYVGQTYQVTQWYPKPAVYDNNGWHPIPYLDQGEFYSEFGNFNVQITVPINYIVAATGELQNTDERNRLHELSATSYQPSAVVRKPPAISRQPTGISKKKPVVSNKKGSGIKDQGSGIKKQVSSIRNPVSSIQPETKTLNYLQNDIHDFAWFADKNFLVRYDTMMLASGKVIDAFSFFTPSGFPEWKNSIQFIKDAIRTRSASLGEYPYNVVTAVEAKMGFNGGMEYPTITSISPMPSAKDLDLTIEHEVGHNWNYGILASNEREHPWMDEGMNTYFDNRYEALKYKEDKETYAKKDFLQIKIPDISTDLSYRTELASKKDQPIETSSENFSELNYGNIAYYKTGKWMKVLEDYIGQPLFDTCLHEYYDRWKFKHPSPDDFKKVVEDVSKKNVDSVFSMLHQKGSMEPAIKKDFKLLPFFSFKDTDKHNYIFISPAVGYNYYDKFMIGGLIHNYTLPEPSFHFFVAPMYATGSKSFTGIGKVGYSVLSYGSIRKAELSVSGEKFTGGQLTDSTGTKNPLGFSKLVPALKIIFRNKNATSSIIKSVQWKTFFIEETSYLFTRDTINQIDIISYPKTKRYLNQLTLGLENKRALYPYSGELQVEQYKSLIRLGFTGNYYFNYAKSGGMNMRLFAGKIFYAGYKTLAKQEETERFRLNMTGPKGDEDYTYSNYFVGRSEFEGFRSQQIMIRDGGFKIRTDLTQSSIKDSVLLSGEIGKTDNWLVAANFTTDFPKQFNPLQALPVKIPLKVFLDVGTYAEAWKKNAPTGKFIYEAGLQLSFAKGMVNIYAPLIYSKVYSNYIKSDYPDKQRFWKNISFSIDIQNFRFSKFFNAPNL